MPECGVLVQEQRHRVLALLVALFLFPWTLEWGRGIGGGGGSVAFSAINVRHSYHQSLPR